MVKSRRIQECRSENIFSLRAIGYRAIERRTLARVLSEHDAQPFGRGGVVSAKETFDYLPFPLLHRLDKGSAPEHMSRVLEQGDFRAMAGNDQPWKTCGAYSMQENRCTGSGYGTGHSGSTVEASFSRLKTTFAIEFAVGGSRGRCRD